MSEKESYQGPEIWNEAYRRGAEYLPGSKNSAERAVETARRNGVDLNRALDLGCGKGQSANQLKELGVAEVVGIDLSDVAIAKARENAEPGVEFRTGDYLKAVLPQKFELIHARLSAGFIPTESLLEKVVQDLTPDGLFYIVTPIRDDQMSEERAIDIGAINQADLTRQLEERFEQVELIRSFTIETETIAEISAASPRPNA